MRMLLILFISTFFQFVANSQITIETFKSDFKKIILEKKFKIWEQNHCKVLFSDDGMESLVMGPYRQYIDISKKGGINDLSKVKIENIGRFLNLFVYYKKRVEDGINNEIIFDEVSSKIILKKNKEFLEGIKDVTIYKLEYEYMNFDVAINDTGWKIIGVSENGIYDTDDFAIRDKLVNHIYRTINRKLD